MWRIYGIAAAAVLAIVLVASGFTYLQTVDQRLSLSADLQYRTRVLGDSLEESVAPSFAAASTSTLQRIVDRIAKNERIVGLGVYNSDGAMVARSSGLPDNIGGPLAGPAMDSDKPTGAFMRVSGSDMYVYAQPLHSDDRVIGALTLVQNASYIDQAVATIWRDNLFPLVVEVILVTAVIFVLVRFIFFRGVSQFAEALSLARRGGEVEVPADTGLFAPISGEIAKFTRSLRQARRAASEEARLRLEKIDSPWTAERLKEYMKAHLKERPIYAVSNREPYVHTKDKRGNITWSVPASGMVTALEPVMEAAGGMWVAHGSGSGDADTVDANGKLMVPPDDPKYTLKRIFLSKEEVQGHYVGFSNEALWPICHQAHTRPIFREEDWKEYRRVNGKFAAALLAEIKHAERPLILVQDFHFALLPAMIKASRPDAMVAIFWHIPWPSAEAFSICPYRAEILEGMLGADLIGFHTQQYCNNFMDTVGSEIEALINLEDFTVTRAGHASKIEPFPISIAYHDEAEMPKTDRSVLDALGIHTPQVIIGVDRLDYIKGIPERLKGFEFMLEQHPEYRGQVTFLQIAPPSREAVLKYREYDALVTAEVACINEKFGTRDWKPIILEKKHYSHNQLNNVYRLANVCVVSSLQDGMNLVAKEYAAARSDEMGVLVLSHFAGASRDLRTALLINPYSAEETAAALYEALTMPPSEQHRRMRAMRERLRDYNIYRWSAEFIKALIEVE